MSVLFLSVGLLGCAGTSVPADTGPPADTDVPNDTGASDTGHGVAIEPVHDLTGVEPDLWTTFGGPSTFDRLLDGSVLVGLQYHWSNEFCIGGAATAGPWPWAHSYPPLLEEATWMTASDYATLPVGGCTRLGERAFGVGDTDGDGLEEVALTAEWPSGLLGAHAVVFEGAALLASLAEGPGELAAALTDVGGWFTRCDVNADGLADLCSTHGVALGPAPYPISAPFPGAGETDRLVWAEVDGVPGLVLSRGAALSFVPATALPPAGEVADLATETASAGGPVLALGLGDVAPAPGEELVGVVDVGGTISVVAWGLAAGLPERARLDTTAMAGHTGALALGDFDGDGVSDLAFASRQRVGVVAGPLGSGRVPVWWTTRVVPAIRSSFGSALLVAGGDVHDALWVGDDEREGPFPPAAGAAFFLAEPLALPE